MKRYLTIVTATCLASGAVHAGALDRSGQSVDVLFEEGRHVEFSFAGVSPELSGEGVGFTAGVSSGDISPSYFQFGGAYKADINDTWSYALIIDQPFLAEVDYPDGTGYFAAGSNAEFNSVALTGLLQYNMSNGISVYGGLRLQRTDANAEISFTPIASLTGYNVDAESDYGVGYVAGVAYERPDIALRVSLTYNSEVSHSNKTTENSVALGGPNISDTDFETPQSVNLAFQTGIAPGTLLFGGVRWVDWDDFDLTPANYQTLTGGTSLLSYEDDVTTYTLGIGRRLNANWALAASLGYERSSGSFFTNLGPSDGQKSIGLAAIYTQGNMEITTGIRYIRIGDTETRAGPVAPAGDFEDNDAVAIGVKVAYKF
ncbi:outer membrane protein transport protein [uncultured Roseobacter sp.]|uniref:OmpP1/FadL family transporter n=1 Tax=uncultured Roseobacter sp. TaxID=114847 RepID=UPI00260C4E62|nr:outer membrane protein transport protein [uncultured Roseobacter sp.]